MDTVFDVFQETAYTFLQLTQGGARGNSVKKSTATTGVFKERNGMVQNNNLETVQSDATLHIHPNEPFIAEVGGTLEGHGIRSSQNGVERTYRITGSVEGRNYDTNELEFYRLTLKAESLVEDGSGSS